MIGIAFREKRLKSRQTQKFERIKKIDKQKGGFDIYFMVPFLMTESQ